MPSNSNNTQSNVLNQAKTNGKNPKEIPSIIDSTDLQELLQNIAPNESFDEEVLDMLMDIANDYVDNIAVGASQLAVHRNSTTLELKDVQKYLKEQYDTTIPGYTSTNELGGTQLLKRIKKNTNLEQHKKRLAAIEKEKLSS